MASCDALSQTQRVLRYALLAFLLVGFICSSLSVADCSFVSMGVSYRFDDDVVEAFRREANFGFGMFQWYVDVSKDVLDRKNMNRLVGETPQELMEDYFGYYDDGYENDELDDDIPFNRVFGDRNFQSSIEWEALAVGKVCINYPNIKSGVVDANNEVSASGSGNGNVLDEVMARVGGVAAALGGGIAFISLGIVTFFVSKESTIVWWIGRIVLVISCLGQCLTFLLFQSDLCKESGAYAECKFGPGAIMSLVALFMYLVSAVLSCVSKAPSQSLCVFNDLATTGTDTSIDSANKKSSMIQAAVPATHHDMSKTSNLDEGEKITGMDTVAKTNTNGGHPLGDVFSA